MWLFGACVGWFWGSEGDPRGLGGYIGPSRRGIRLVDRKKRVWLVIFRRDDKILTWKKGARENGAIWGLRVVVLGV